MVSAVRWALAIAAALLCATVASQPNLAYAGPHEGGGAFHGGGGFHRRQPPCFVIRNRRISRSCFGFFLDPHRIPPDAATRRQISAREVFRRSAATSCAYRRHLTPRSPAAAPAPACPT